MEQITNYIKPELLVLIPVCWGIGLLLKSIPGLPNGFIPAILCICSLTLSSLYIVGIGDVPNVAMGIFLAFTQGLLVWFAAWVSYESGIKKIGIATESQSGGVDVEDNT